MLDSLSDHLLGHTTHTHTPLGRQSKSRDFGQTRQSQIRSEEVKRILKKGSEGYICWILNQNQYNMLETTSAYPCNVNSPSMYPFESVNITDRYRLDQNSMVWQNTEMEFFDKETTIKGTKGIRDDINETDETDEVGFGVPKQQRCQANARERYRTHRYC